MNPPLGPSSCRFITSLPPPPKSPLALFEGGEKSLLLLSLALVLAPLCAHVARASLLRARAHAFARSTLPFLHDFALSSGSHAAHTKKPSLSHSTPNPHPSSLVALNRHAFSLSLSLARVPLSCFARAAIRARRFDKHTSTHPGRHPEHSGSPKTAFPSLNLAQFAIQPPR